MITIGVVGFVADIFGRQLICSIVRSPKLLKPGNQVQAGNQKSPFYFLLNLSHNICGSNLVSTASTRRLWQTPLGLGQRTTVGIPINAIALWIGQHQGDKVSLLQLQQSLGMPLVEVWLGLLHSPTPYQWNGQGEFYREHLSYAISINT